MGPLHDLLRQLADGVPDAELLRRFTAGDEAAFELLVWRHGGLVLSACRRVLGVSPDAEDAFQATFLALARKAATVRDGAALVGWLLHVARRASLRALRTARRRAARERVGLPEDAAAAEEPPAFELQEAFDDEVARLPELMRVAFVLCEREGLTAAEAAARIGCPQGTVLSRLSRARERLRARLTRRGHAGLVAATLRAAGGAASASVLSLTQGVLREMFYLRLRAAVAVLSLALVAGLGGVLALRLQAGEKADPPERLAEPDPARPVRLALKEKEMTHVEDVAFSPDGRLLVTSGGRPKRDGRERRVLVWDAATGKLLHAIDRSDGFGTGLAFSPDGKTLAVNLREGLVGLFAVGSWKRRATLEGDVAVTAVAFSPDGKTIATRGSLFSALDRLSDVRLWDAGTGKERLRLKRAADESFRSMAFSPDGKTLAVGSSEGAVRLVAVATGKERELDAGPLGSAFVAYSPDGKTLATWGLNLGQDAEDDRTVKLWDVGAAKVRRTVAVKATVHVAAFAPDGKALAVATEGGAVGLFDPATGKPSSAEWTPDAAPTHVSRVAFSPDGKTLAVSGLGTKDGVARSITRLFSPAGGADAAAPERTRGVTFAARGGRAALLVADDEEATERRPDEVTILNAADLLPKK